MNAHPARIIAAPIRDTYELDCTECEGSGEIAVGKRWAGEGNGGEWLSETCSACMGAASFTCCSYCDVELEAGETCSACADDLEPIVDAVPVVDGERSGLWL